MGKEPSSSHVPPAPQPHPERLVRCYHCKTRIAVPLTARTASCPVCYKGVVLDDLAVKDAGWNGRLSTCGQVKVERKGRAIARSVECGEGLTIDGTLEAKINSGGPVTLSPGGKLKGDCDATSLVVPNGAIIEGGFFRIGKATASKPIAPGS
jgi:hypothetical protein